MAIGERWHALQVTCREERRIAKRLASRGFESFLPGQPGKSDSLLFEGVVFCRFQPRQSMDILETRGVDRILAMEGDHCAEEPVRNLRKLIDSGRSFIPVRRASRGKPVRVEHGPLQGITGVLAPTSGAVRVVVAWNGLRGGVAVDLEEDFVTFLEPAGAGTKLLQ